MCICLVRIHVDDARGITLHVIVVVVVSTICTYNVIIIPHASIHATPVAIANIIINIIAHIPNEVAIAKGTNIAATTTTTVVPRQ